MPRLKKQTRWKSWTAGVLAGGDSAVVRMVVQCASFLTRCGSRRSSAGEDAGGPKKGVQADVERKPHLGWRSRGYLPHFDAAHVIQHIVFSLADAMPPAFRAPSAMHADRALDRGHGSCLLREPRCAAMVEDALLRADAERYRLLAWCVMPNHVHVVAEQLEGCPLGDVVQAWKSTAAHEINHALGRKGRLWRREYFDRFMRDDDHLSTTIAYVENNPVAAGLVAAPADWRWSSARRR